MTALPNLSRIAAAATPAPWKVTAAAYDPATRDMTHEQARAARECAEWQLWLTTEGKRPQTREDYLRTAANLLRRNPDTPFAAYTSAQVMETLVSYPRGSQRKVRAHLQSFFAWGVLHNLIDRNPLERVPHIRRPAQKIVETFTEAECAALMGPPLIDGALFTIMLEAGLRKSECRQLQRKHVDLERMQVVVVDGKGGKGRIVPFASTSRIVQAVADLDLMERLEPSSFMWYRRRPRGAEGVLRDVPVGDGTFHRWWERAIRAAGVAYVPGSLHNPHTTRHTFATRLLRQGLPLESVSMLMGHSSISTTFDLYGHLDMADIRDQLEQLARR